MDQTILSEAFAHARLKVNRAYRHLQEANGLFRLYVESDFCKLVEERNPETGAQDFHVEAAPIPVDLVLAIGDTFHNLSAALDYIMTGMMRAAGISATRVGFPTNETRRYSDRASMRDRSQSGIAPEPQIRAFSDTRRIKHPIFLIFPIDAFENIGYIQIIRSKEEPK